MNTNHPLPPFDKLPLDPNGPVGNAWGLFGHSDELGMLNLLTPERVAEAAKEIKEGVRISLDWPLSKPSYPSFDRAPFQQRIVKRGTRAVNDDILEFNTQCSSQWDGFRHYGNQKFQCYFNGITQTHIENTPKMGIDVWTENGGIIGRGVLLDYADWAQRRGIELKPFESVPIKLADLKSIIEEQDVKFRTGDILFIRSGFSAAYNALSPNEQKILATRPSPDFIGLEATLETLKWIWDNGFAAVASDAPSFERAPIAGNHHDPDVMLHQWLLAGWGMPIGELFDLEKLSEYCRKTSRRSFFLASIPLKVPGGVASPPNAVAIF